MWAYLLNRKITLQLVGYSQDPAGGAIPGPSPLAVEVAVGIQQDSPPQEDGKSQYRKAARSEVTLYLSARMSPDPVAALAAIRQLQQESRVVLDDGRTVVLEGEPFDRSGQGVIYEAACKYLT